MTPRSDDVLDEAPTAVDVGLPVDDTSKVNPSKEVAAPPRNDEDEGEHEYSRRSFGLTITSNLLFLIASVLYLWIAVIALRWENTAASIPDYVLQADDDYSWQGWYADDDYVFEAGSTWITRYQIVFFSAALCYVLTGVIDWINHPGWLSIFMFLAGAFGLVSSIMLEANVRLSTIFNLVSVHLFALEAGSLLFGRQVFGGLKWWYHLSDFFFVVGALIDVGLGYAYLYIPHTVPLAKLAVAASFLWLATAVIYICATIYIKRRSGFDRNYGYTPSTEANRQPSSSVTDPHPLKEREYTRETLMEQGEEPAANTP